MLCLLRFWPSPQHLVDFPVSRLGCLTQEAQRDHGTHLPLLVFCIEKGWGSPKAPQTTGPAVKGSKVQRRPLGAQLVSSGTAHTVLLSPKRCAWSGSQPLLARAVSQGPEVNRDVVLTQHLLHKHSSC